MNKLITLILTVLVWNVSAITVDEILDKAEANEKAKSMRSEITQKVYNSKGKERVSKLVSYSKDEGDKGLMEYVSPKRIMGMKILMKNEGDDIWLYSNRTGRVRKIASSQKNQSVNGSDFSYDDMSAKDMRKDYNTKLIGSETMDGKDCYKIELKAKDKDHTYSKSLLWVDKSNFVMIKGEFYDWDNALWKVMTMADVKKVGKYWTAKSIEMKNVQKGTKTVMEMNKLEYDIEVNDAMFSEKNLKR